MQSREISMDREKIAKKDVGKMVTNNEQRTTNNEQKTTNNEQRTFKTRKGGAHKIDLFIIILTIFILREI